MKNAAVFLCAQVWSESGKKGVYPLLFVNDKFIADVCHHLNRTSNTSITLVCLLVATV